MSASQHEELLRLLKMILKIDAIPPEIESKLKDECMDKGSFMMLNDVELEKLGFKMGQRKYIINYIATTASAVNTDKTPVLDNCPRSHQTSCVAGSVTPTTANAESAENFKHFSVDDLISSNKKLGPAFVQRLKDGDVYTPRERNSFIKNVCRYMMNHSQIPDRPSKSEKINMAQSIIEVFPVLKDSVTGGFETFYHPRSHTGHLESFIRCRRSRDPSITTMWTHRTARTPCNDLPTPSTSSADERSLRERRPNVTNKPELLSLMDRTRDERRTWIRTANPPMTVIMDKYPRFKDVPDAVRDEYHCVSGTEKSLAVEWLLYKSKLLEMASKSQDREIKNLLDEITNELDEDMKSLVAFKVLVCLTPAPPKRGVKRPRTTTSARILDFFTDFKTLSTEECINELLKRNPTESEAEVRGKKVKPQPQQPQLFRTQEKFYIKADSTAIAITDASCFVDAVEFLFMCFFSFDVQYPFELRYFYGAFEKMLGISSSVGKSSVLDMLFKSLKPSVNQLSASENTSTI